MENRLPKVRNLARARTGKKSRMRCWKTLWMWRGLCSALGSAAMDAGQLRNFPSDTRRRGTRLRGCPPPAQAGSSFMPLRRAPHRPVSTYTLARAFSYRMPTTLVADASGVDAAAASRRRPQAGGQPRKHSPHWHRRTNAKLASAQTLARKLRCQRHHLVPHSHVDQGYRTHHAELVLQLREVVSHRLLAELELLSHLQHRLPLCNEAEHIELAG